MSTILYLNSTENTNVGGPSLITNQLLSSKSLTNTQGWLAFGKPRRMVAFDGKVLHGVIPGKGFVKDTVDVEDDDAVELGSGDDDSGDSAERTTSTSTSSRPQQQKPRRRVTLMLAFWKDIKIRPSNTPGAARPWPIPNDDNNSNSKNDVIPSWATKLNAKVDDTSTATPPSCTWAQPVSIGNVYEDLEGRPLSNNTMPEYEQVFQGF
ncbi:MAG: hypothetical protein SGARI_000405 [Bacillariaceae sp.]